MEPDRLLDRPTSKPPRSPEPDTTRLDPTARDVLDLSPDEKNGSAPDETEARRPGQPDESDKPDRDTPPRKADDDGSSDESDDKSTDDDASAKGGDAAKSDSHGSIEGGRRFVKKHPIAVLVGLVVLAAAIVLGVLYWLHARHFESTDDAFIDGRTVSIAPEVTGNIVEVPVNDNEVVHPGDVLARIDDRDYRAAVDNAQAQIEQAEAAITNGNAQIAAQQAQIEQSKKQVTEAQAALNFATDENTRYQDLVRTGAGTVQRAQQAASDLQQRQASFSAAQAAQLAAEKQIAVYRAQVKSGEAQRAQAVAQKAQADANLTRTTLHATIDGRVARLTGAVGQVATQQSALMVLVPLDLWVTANFKETQLALMRPGQPVDIEVDAFGRTFKGHVDSIQAGSGTAFSLLPAENATGNYVKVVQRVPVKIVFDTRPDVELGPGMSVVPTVTVR